MKLVALIIFSFFLSLHSFTQTYKKVEKVAQCKKSIQDKQKAMKSLTADFKETVYSSMFETPQKGSGKLYYKQSQKIRWEKTEPKKSVILINGKTISDSIREVMHTDFRHIKLENYSIATIDKIKEQLIGMLPVIDEDGKLVKLLDLKKLRSVLPVAGFASLSTASVPIPNDVNV